MLNTMNLPEDDHRLGTRREQGRHPGALGAGGGQVKRVPRPRAVVRQRSRARTLSAPHFTKELGSLDERVMEAVEIGLRAVFDL
ncbi:hypothetical protein SAMN02787118_103318 [Streptomyces mirabilis]|jgi:hypothetical protein|uniref:Uncharacterized protein n=1 Tax=Streptomyces mirabilis TaxID=68239 RepID=A0A1I2F7L9_9ACTN|nr:hypothetical protein SAMN02787118_103318 [Streptomyces mirabilis]